MREHKDILSPFLPWLQQSTGKRWCIETTEKMPQWLAPTSEKILCGVDIPHPLGFLVLISAPPRKSKAGCLILYPTEVNGTDGFGSAESYNLSGLFTESNNLPSSPGCTAGASVTVVGRSFVI
jgi:hypothetical protein